MDLQSSSPEGINDLIIVSQHRAAAGTPNPTLSNQQFDGAVDPVDQ